MGKSKRVTVNDLMNALESLPADAEIGANHTTTELFCKDSTGRPRRFFTFWDGSKRVEDVPRFEDDGC